MLGDLTTPESGSCCKALGCVATSPFTYVILAPCQVIQSMLQSKLQESVAVLDPEIEVSNLDALSEKYANAKACRQAAQLASNTFSLVPLAIKPHR